MRHAHPLTILANLWRVLYLTIIPVLRGFFYALQGDLGQWVQSAWIDILVFLAMILIAVWRWWVVTYTYDEDEVLLHSGWLVLKRIRVRWDRITTISVLEPFYLRPFRAARLRADTIGGSAGSADFSILVWREEARRIIGRGLRQGGRWEAKEKEYVPRTSSILALSLLTSNSLVGILFVAAFISQSGKLLGNEFSEMLIDTFEEVARMLAFGLPPAAAAIGYALLGGWLIGFVITFCRYKNFTVRRKKDILSIRGGLLSHREYCIHYRDINFIDIRQSMTTKVLRLYSLYISAVGYAKQRDDISCVIPTENSRVFDQNRQRLFPALAPSPRQIAPRFSGIMRFIGVALSLCAALPLATWVLIRFFPNWRSFILFVGLMSTVPAVYFLIVRIVEFATGGISKKGKKYTMRYSKGFYLHTVIIPEDKIVSIELRQSLFQKYTPNCDLIIGTRSETRLQHRCRNLDKERLREMLDL